MTTTSWKRWLMASRVGGSLPFVRGQRYRVTSSPVKNKPELSFDVVGTFDRALTQLLFVDDNGVERRVNSATITGIEELT